MTIMRVYRISGNIGDHKVRRFAKIRLLEVAQQGQSIASIGLRKFGDRNLGVLILTAKPPN